jgi:hypothetical protein
MRGSTVSAILKREKGNGTLKPSVYRSGAAASVDEQRRRYIFIYMLVIEDAGERQRAGMRCGHYVGRATKWIVCAVQLTQEGMGKR